MVEKYINSLNKQIERLNAKDFDLEAWKSSTIVLLERIFGRDSQKITQIENVKFDFGSWSLRDSSAGRTPLDSCKMRGKEILEIAIEELEDFGIPEENKTLVGNSVVLEALENELKGSQFKQLKNLLISDESFERKKNQLKETLDSFGEETRMDILTC